MLIPSSAVHGKRTLTRSCTIHLKIHVYSFGTSVYCCIFCCCCGGGACVWYSFTHVLMLQIYVFIHLFVYFRCSNKNIFTRNALKRNAQIPYAVWNIIALFSCLKQHFILNKYPRIRCIQMMWPWISMIPLSSHFVIVTPCFIAAKNRTSRRIIYSFLVSARYHINPSAKF